MNSQIQKISKADAIKLECKGLVGTYKGIPIIEVPVLVSWLNNQKQSDNAIVKELNCFIDDMIKKLENNEIR